MPLTERMEQTQAEFAAACMAQVPVVLRYIRAATRAHHDAEDLAQDVVVQALGSGQRLGDVALTAWLLRIARNRVAEFYRRKAIERRGADKMRAETLNTGLISGADPVCSSDIRAAALQAIEALDDTEREALTLKFSTYYSNVEIAAIMQLTPGNLGVILCRALKKVRQTLKEQGHDFE